MLLLLAIAAADAPLVVDIAGMPPQLEIIRAEAARNGWAIVCTGHSGEEGVLRISAPPGDPSAKLRAYREDPNHVGSGDWPDGFGGKALPASCNHEPGVLTASSDAPATTLGYSSPELLQQTLSIAKACGFSRAFIRPLKNDDPGYDQLPDHQGWQTLEAGENIVPRNGPMFCYLQMVSRLGPAQITKKAPRQNP